MSSSTKHNAARIDGIHIGRDGLSYALECIAEEEPVRKCSFCGGAYRNIGVQVQTQCGLELCPECISSGPRAVAKALEGNADLREAREVFGRLANFEQVPGGILAVKVAEGYRQVGGPGITSERSRLGREV